MQNFFNKLLELDNLIFTHVVLLERIQLLDNLIPWINWLAQNGALWLLILLFLAAFRGLEGRKIFFVGIISMALAWGLSEGIKNLIARPRPFNEITDVFRLVNVLLKEPSSSSFPSEPTSLAFAAVTVLLAHSEQKQFRFIVVFLAFIIAYSMVYAGINYPLDVIGGAVLGWLCARLAMGKLYKINLKRNRKSKRRIKRLYK